jgi:hypothetical protein
MVSVPSNTKLSRYREFIIWSAAAAGAATLWLPALTVLALSPIAPSGVVAFVDVQLILTFVLALLAITFALIGLVFRTYRRRSLLVIVAAICCLAMQPVGLKISLRVVRPYLFEGLAERSQALVQAIRLYDADYRRPPASLANLVPEYLPEIPRTGMTAYPDYKYKVCNVSDECEGNAWVSSVPTPIGFLNWDEFVYYPSGNYPPTDFRGWLEPVRDWAYVHE